MSDRDRLPSYTPAYRLDDAAILFRSPDGSQGHRRNRMARLPWWAWLFLAAIMASICVGFVVYVSDRATAIPRSATRIDTLMPRLREAAIEHAEASHSGREAPPSGFTIDQPTAGGSARR